MSVLNPWARETKAAGVAAERWCAVVTPEPMAELGTLLAAMRLDAAWCEHVAADPLLPRRHRARLHRLARRLEREIAALTPKPGRQNHG